MARRIRRLSVATLALSAILAAAAGSQQPPARPAEQPAAPPAEPRAQLTETVGLLSGLYLYQTYLNIGLLADGKAERVYDEKAARAVLATVVTPLDAVDKQLAKVGALAQTEADRQAAARLRQLVGLLRQQGQQLVTFWDSGKSADGARYEATRQAVWKQLNALLGLDKK
jgi:hypothetical protein